MKLFKDFGVRSLFGTLIILGFLVSMFYSMIHNPNLLPFIKDCFVPIVLCVISFYFGQRSVQKGSEE